MPRSTRSHPESTGLSITFASILPAETRRVVECPALPFLQDAEEIVHAYNILRSGDRGLEMRRNAASQRSVARSQDDEDDPEDRQVRDTTLQAQNTINLMESGV
jgi:hypothetical protein